MLASRTTALEAAAVPAVTPSSTPISDAEIVVLLRVRSVATNEDAVKLLISIILESTSNTSALEALAVPGVTPSSTPISDSDIVVEPIVRSPLVVIDVRVPTEVIFG